MANTPKYRLMTSKTLMRTLTALISLTALSSLILAGLAMPLVGAIGLTTRYTTEAFEDIPSELDIMTPSQQSVMYASDGTEIARFYAENRIVVPISDMSEWIQKAIVAVEDRRFYTHKGVDVEGLARAATNNVLGRDIQGASTLTQQYVKNTLIEHGLQAGDTVAIEKASEHSLARKLKEARFAIELEKEMPKKQILQGYLNIAPFGIAVYGVEAAAQRFFSIHAKDLNLAQSALLAGLVQSPSAYDPIQHPQAAQARRDDVLAAMLSANAITKAQYDEAKAVNVEKSLKPSQPLQGCATAGNAGYFCSWVMAQLMASPQLGKTLSERRTALLRGGLKIYTTLNIKDQEAANKSVLQWVPRNDPSGVNVGLFSVQPDTGNILAIAQNTTFGKPSKEDPSATENSFTADEAHGGGPGQQTGSSFKAFTLAAWYEAGYSAYDWVGGSLSYKASDFKSSCPEAIPADYSFKNSLNRGPAKTTVRYGTETSLNSTFIGMATKLDLCNIYKLSQKLGAVPGAPVSEDQKLFYPGNLLGSGVVPPAYMANVWAAFVNNGKQCKLNSVLRVVDNKGKELLKVEPECEQVMREKTAKQVAKTLNFTYESYGRAADIGRPAATKTGTTDDASASWIVGATPNVATAVWSGHAKGLESMTNVTIGGKFYETVWGVTIPAYTWRDYMKVATADLPVKEIPDVDLNKPTMFPPPPPKPEKDESKDKPSDKKETKSDTKKKPSSTSSSTKKN